MFTFDFLSQLFRLNILCCCLVVRKNFVIILYNSNFVTMPYTKEEIEEKLRKALDASHVVRFMMRYFMLFPLNCDSRELWAWLDGCI